MKDFLIQWEKEYKEKSEEILLFTDVAKELTIEQKQKFVKLFYHARGHFGDFLWHMATMAPDHAHKKVLLNNIVDELGGEDEARVSHERLYFKFGKALDVDVYEEIKSEKNYLPFLKKFNAGHMQSLFDASWEKKWILFSAYELLDNVDYDNLYDLAVNMGLSDDALIFFEVHRDGDHFTETFDLLGHIWKKDEKSVREGFKFIGEHQLTMWRQMSDAVVKE